MTPNRHQADTIAILDKVARCRHHGPMLLSQLFSDPWITLATLAAFLFALSVHEASHALAAFALGDKTAYREHRITLNPIAHLDWMGFLMLITIGFGWGKPVPFNPYNLKYQRVGPALIAAAGPLSNFILGTLATFIYVFIFTTFGPTNLLTTFFGVLAVMSFLLGLFNLIPLPPLDGSKALFAALAAPKYDHIRRFLETRGPMILLGLVFLDLVLGINAFEWIHVLAASIVTHLLSLVT